jgi:hypothetical protein
MRTDITERYYRVLTRQNVDRLPDLEFGYWPQTIRRWLGEGLPLDLDDEEKEQMFLGKLDDFLCFERYGHGLNLRLHMNPTFEERVIERRGDITVMRDTSGVIAERYRNDVDESSIPRFLEFPVKDRASWLDMKRRFRVDDPTRFLSEEAIRDARDAASEGKMVTVFFVGFYGQLRNWMGMESLSLAFYDQPALIAEMVEHWAELCAHQIERLPADLPIDYVSWWEDMAGRNGPLVSPTLFRRFLQPGYRRVMDQARKHGCVLAHVDCDGNPHDIVANWLEEGVNVMFPLEVQAGVDPFAWRREFGKDLLLRGGIGKEPLVKGGAAIDRELDRIKPLLEQGGFVPHLDHLVPPDIPYAHYLDYLEKKRKLIGRA